MSAASPFKMISNSQPSQSSFRKSHRAIFKRSKRVARQTALTASSWSVAPLDESEYETGSLLRSRETCPSNWEQARLRGTMFVLPEVFAVKRAKFADDGSSAYTIRAARAASMEKTPTLAPISTTTEPRGMLQCMVYARWYQMSLKCGHKAFSGGAVSTEPSRS